MKTTQGGGYGNLKPVADWSEAQVMAWDFGLASEVEIEGQSCRIYYPMEFHATSI